MAAYLLRRLIAAIGVIFGISLITFVMIFLMPSDPARLYAGPRAPEATVQSIREQWGLNDPVLTQYVRYVGRALQGDLGRSPRDGQKVLPAIIERIPATLQLALAGLFVELIL